MTRSNQPNFFQKEKKGSISDSQDEGTVTEIITTHEVFLGTGSFGEGREDVNIEGNTL